MPLVSIIETVDNLDVEVELLKTVTAASGSTISRGDLVSLASGKVIPFLTGEDPYTVMYEDVDASAGEVEALAYRKAEIKASEVNFGTGTDAEVRDALDFKGIYLID